MWFPGSCATPRSRSFPVDRESADRALSAWRRYGKGRHPAGLNYGDCFVYALAERSGAPVLCTGDDFASAGVAVLRPTQDAEPFDIR